ncbi:ROK family transcriptional regulator [Actinomyces timonensis]|uniref:ROK family transcriptional regulator n=1 Tax=Actinomyces timonensis TaxID=1288391 RepID=A0AAU8N3N9_9ACTO
MTSRDRAHPPPAGAGAAAPGAPTRAHAAPPTAPGAWSGLSGTQRRIALELLRHGRMSRADLMERVRISAGSITRLTSPMLESGTLLAAAERVSATGRPQSHLEVDAGAERLVGVTLSGRHLTAVLTDLRLTVLASTRLEITDHAPEAVVALLARAVGDLRSRLTDDGTPVTGLGLTLGGSSRDGRAVDEAVFLGWHGVRLAEAVEAATGIPTLVGNDLTAMTERELWFGAGREHERFSLVTVGAGIGYGLVVNGSVVSSPDAQLGLMGMVPVPDGGFPPVSSPAMACLTDAALERAWSERLEAGGRHWGPDRGARAARILSLAEDGDGDAVAVCASFARRLGRFIGITAAFTLPETVIVAGERASVASLFEAQVMAGIAAVRRSSAAPLDVVVREHDRAQWARGAAVLVLRARIAGEL